MEKPRRNKRFLFKELAERYRLHSNTIRRILKDLDLRTVDGAVRAVRRLDKRVLFEAEE